MTGGNRLQSPSVNRIFSLSLTPIRAATGLRPGSGQSRTARYPPVDLPVGHERPPLDDVQHTADDHGNGEAEIGDPAQDPQPGPVLDQHTHAAHGDKPENQGAEYPVPLRHREFRPADASHPTAPRGRRVLQQP